MRAVWKADVPTLTYGDIERSDGTSIHEAAARYESLRLTYLEPPNGMLRWRTHGLAAIDEFDRGQARGSVHRRPAA